jgi:hypothetical protein
LIASARGRDFRFHEPTTDNLDTDGEPTDAAPTGRIIVKRLVGMEWETDRHGDPSVDFHKGEYKRHVADRWAALPESEKTTLAEYEKIDAALRRVKANPERPSRGFTTDRELAEYVGVSAKQVVRWRGKHDWPVDAGKFYPPADFIAKAKAKAERRRTKEKAAVTAARFAAKVQTKPKS